jgi:ABC-type Fe3+-hydroxamate transport system substrate-binding protein
MRDRLLSTLAALTLLAGSLSAQGAASSERPAANGKVVAHSAGDVELPAPAARSVRVGGTVKDTLDGSTLGGARRETDTSSSDPWHRAGTRSA